MGVSGAGKTTVGRCLAYNLGWQFIEGDDFHPIENILKGNYNLIRHRIEIRQGHFMKATLLPSQVSALEEPVDVLTVNITKSPAIIANIIAQKLELKSLYQHFFQDNAG